MSVSADGFTADREGALGWDRPDRFIQPPAARIASQARRSVAAALPLRTRSG